MVVEIISFPGVKSPDISNFWRLASPLLKLVRGPCYCMTYTTAMNVRNIKMAKKHA